VVTPLLSGGVLRYPPTKNSLKIPPLQSFFFRIPPLIAHSGCWISKNLHVASRIWTRQLPRGYMIFNIYFLMPLSEAKKRKKKKWFKKLKNRKLRLICWFIKPEHRVHRFFHCCSSHPHFKSISSIVVLVIHRFFIVSAFFLSFFPNRVLLFTKFWLINFILFGIRVFQYGR
jgi:hypothetical protein